MTAEQSGSYDVIVVGGGPTGSVAATDLALRGIRTLVLEKTPSVGTAATSLMVTAVLTFRAAPDPGPGSGQSTPIEVRYVQTGEVLLAVTLALLALSTLDTVLLGWSNRGAGPARPDRRPYPRRHARPGRHGALRRATPAAVPGLVAGIPAGLVLYWAFSITLVTPPAAWLLTAALAVLPAVGALTALPAWAHTHSPAGRVLHAESA